MLNKSCKYTGANLLRDLNMPFAFFSISRSTLELFSYLSLSNHLAARFCNFCARHELRAQ